MIFIKTHHYVNYKFYSLLIGNKKYLFKKKAALCMAADLKNNY